MLTVSSVDKNVEQLETDTLVVYNHLVKQFGIIYASWKTYKIYKTYMYI